MHHILSQVFTSYYYKSYWWISNAGWFISNTHARQHNWNRVEFHLKPRESLCAWRKGNVIDAPNNETNTEMLPNKIPLLAVWGPFRAFDSGTHMSKSLSKTSCTFQIRRSGCVSDLLQSSSPSFDHKKKPWFLFWAFDLILWLKKMHVITRPFLCS
jgi:hypothetical protein